MPPVVTVLCSEPKYVDKMKHAKRMVFVPEDVLHGYEQKQRLETSPIIANILHKDTDMSNILHRTDIDNSEKQKLYYANLERYLDLRKQKDRQIPTVRVAPVVKKSPRKGSSWLMPPLWSIYLEPYVLELRHF